MQKKSLQKILLVLSLILVLLLSACQVNVITEIGKDGSGVYTQEIGFQGDEASMAGMSADSEDFCANQNDTLPPGTTTRQETRNKDETWCVYETPFNSIEELNNIYSLTDTTINQLTLQDGILTYDLSLDLSGDSAPMGAEVYWKVTMPGKILENNAAEQMDNTLSWKMIGGEINHIQAVSEVGAAGLDMNFDLDLGAESPILVILGGLAVGMFCCLLPLVIAGVAFILIRRKKKALEVQEAPQSV
jgi:hypothetical protein